MEGIASRALDIVHATPQKKDAWILLDNSFYDGPTLWIMPAQTNKLALDYFPPMQLREYTANDLRDLLNEAKIRPVRMKFDWTIDQFEPEPIRVAFDFVAPTLEVLQVHVDSPKIVEITEWLDSIQLPRLRYAYWGMQKGRSSFGVLETTTFHVSGDKFPMLQETVFNTTRTIENLPLIEYSFDNPPVNLAMFDRDTISMDLKNLKAPDFYMKHEWLNGIRFEYGQWDAIDSRKGAIFRKSDDELEKLNIKLFRTIRDFLNYKPRPLWSKSRHTATCMRCGLPIVGELP